MNVTEAIRQIKDRVNDMTTTGYSSSMILGYINDALSYLSYRMAAVCHPALVQDMTITDGMPVPSGFIKFVGTEPVRRTGMVFHILDESDTIAARAYIELGTVGLQDDIPLKEPAYISMLLQLASIYALNQHEYNDTQDAALAKELQAAVDPVMGASR